MRGEKFTKLLTVADDERLQKKLAGYDWRRLLRHVLCPARVHFEGEVEADYAALFYHSIQPEDIAAFRSRCEIPPLLCGDFEWGEGFPAMFGCGAAGDPDLAYAMGKAVALQKRKQGFHWTLAPVCDIALDIDSPMLGLRAAGEDPDRVASVTTAYLRGLQDHGLAATAKHFPGDGFNSLDQHVTTPVNFMSEGEWRASYGRVFGEAINAGVACIMPGHLGLAWADQPDSRNGVYPPATVSRRLLKELLRDEMGFGGLIVSDAMGMGGVAGFMNVFDASAAFLEAGGDCLLFARHDAFFEKEMERCLREGKLTEDTLFLRALNILRFKERVGLFRSDPADCPEMPKAERQEAVRAMTEKAVQVVRDLPHRIPVKAERGMKILHVFIGNNSEGGEQLKPFVERLTAESGGEVTCWEDPGPGKLFFTLRDKPYDMVVVSLGNYPDYGANIHRLHGPVARNFMDGWMHLGVPVVFVQHGYPFHHRHYPAAMETVISTHGSNDYTYSWVAKGLFGKVELRHA